MTNTLYRRNEYETLQPLFNASNVYILGIYYLKIAENKAKKIRNRFHNRLRNEF